MLLALGRARIGAGRVAAGTDSCRAAADVGRALGDPVLVARAALAYGAVITPGRRDPALLALLEEALATLPEEALAVRAAVLARLAGALQPADEPEEPMRLARDAVVLARRCGDARTLCAALHGAGAALAVHAGPGERARFGEEHERVAFALGDRTQLLHARRRLFFAYLELGDLAAADRALEAFEAVARQSGRPHELWPALAMRSARSALLGRFREADELAEEAAALSAELDPEHLNVNLACQTMSRLISADRLDDASAFRPVLWEALGGSEQAAFEMTYFDALVEMLLGRPIREDPRSPMLAFWVCRGAPRTPSVHFADFIATFGDAEQRAELRERLAADGDHLACSAFAMSCDAPVAYSVGVISASLGRMDDAVHAFEQAEARAEALALAPSLARTRCRLGEALLERGAAGDRERAVRVLGDACESARDLGLPRVLARSETALGGALGVPRAATPPAGTSALGAPAPAFRLEREGEVWAVHVEGSVFRLKDSRGVRSLARLVESPGREFHALDLVAQGTEAVDGGDAGELLDARALEAYRSRVERLDEAIEEAESFNDLERLTRARAEREQIAAELARAVGRGGRTRRAGSAVERARIAVQRRLRDAIERVAEAHPALGRHLARSIQTGTYCSYEPDGPRRLRRTAKTT